MQGEMECHASNAKPCVCSQRANEKSQEGSIHGAPETWGKKGTPTAFMLNMEGNAGLGSLIYRWDLGQYR